MHLFYGSDISGNYHSLNKEESNHAIRVLRLKQGGIIYLTDGKGGLYKAEIIESDHKTCTVKIIDVQKEYKKKGEII